MNRYEFTSRTQKSIRKISTLALKARERGITAVHSGINFARDQENREVARDLIASLNYSTNQARKELSFRERKSAKGDYSWSRLQRL